MRSRLIAHSLLALSVILAGIVIGDTYGGVVTVNDQQKERILDEQRPPIEYRFDGRIESFRFENRATVNDTVTITVRNSGTIPIFIRYVIINDLPHASFFDGYMFDKEGHFYLSRVVPAGGFGIIKTNTLPHDLEPKENSYNVTMRTNIGMINGSFTVDGGTFHHPSAFEPFTPYAFVFLLGSTVILYYYRRLRLLS